MQPGTLLDVFFIPHDDDFALSCGPLAIAYRESSQSEYALVPMEVLAALDLTV